MHIFPSKLTMYRNWNIKLKLFVINALLILCSVFAVSVLSYIQYTKDSNRQSLSRNQQIIEQAAMNIDTYLDDLVRLSQSIYFNNEVMKLLEGDAPQTESEQLYKSRSIENFLNMMMITPRKDIIRVHIITDNVYGSSRSMATYDNNTDFTSFDWYKDSLKNSDTLFIPVHTEEMDNNPDFKIFSITQQIRSITNSNKTLGLIKVDANYGGIQDICNKINMGREGAFFIIDENKNIIYPNAGGISYNSLEKFIIKKDFNPYTGLTVYMQNKKFIINAIKMSRSNWQIIAFSSLKDLNENAVITRNTAFLLAIACSVSALIILSFFVKRFLKPLFEIIKLTKKIQEGDLTVKYNCDTNDEIAYLGASFNEMVIKINDMLNRNTLLVKEVYEKSMLQKEAQMSALYSQIRPHFIYNTLNTISILIQSGNHEGAVTNVQHLSSMLRKIAVIKDETTLESEVELLYNYLNIQKIRFGSRLNYSIDIDNALYTINILPLLFQPIVENAVSYGCESKKESTFIKIYSSYENNNIIFNIDDNGIGMCAEKLTELKQKIDNPTFGEYNVANNHIYKKGIGLVNVSRRIKLKYGQEYGLELNSISNAGTKVKIILPGYLKEI